MRSFGGLLLFVSLSFFVSQAFAADPPVKLSASGICHDETSAFYSRTKKYTVYENIEACLSSGGRLPKGHAKYSNIATSPTSGKYNRDDWKHWSDIDSDCQDTRAEILIGQSLTAVIFDKSDMCRVDRGKWYDPYSDSIYIDDDNLDIDHIVPLGYASARGGSAWSKELKEQFANDPENLIAVDKYLNRQKGAAGPAEWMPPNHKYRCEYLKSFNGVVQKYGLQYFSAEKRVIDKMLAACS
jgi:hypothetical protein